MDDESSGGGDGWLVSFADLMTLLFATFVVLYGTLNVGTNPKYLGVAAAIRESFVEMSSDLSASDSEIIVGARLFVFKASKGDSSRSIARKQIRIKEHAFATFESDRRKVESFLDRIATENGKLNYKLRKSMVVSEHERGLTIRLVGAYFFKKNHYHLTRKGRKRIKKLGHFLREVERRLLIEGHTSVSEDQGKFDSMSLGSLRAAATAKVLITDHQFIAHQIKTISYGHMKPVEKDEVKNRRIEIKIFYN